MQNTCNKRRRNACDKGGQKDEQIYYDAAAIARLLNETEAADVDCYEYPCRCLPFGQHARVCDLHALMAVLVASQRRLDVHITVDEPTYDGARNGLGNMRIEQFNATTTTPDAAPSTAMWRMQILPTGNYSLLDTGASCNEHFDAPTCRMHCQHARLAENCQCRIASVHEALINLPVSATANLRPCTLDDVRTCAWSTERLRTCQAHACQPRCAHVTYALTDVRNTTGHVPGVALSVTANFVANEYVSYTQKRTFTWDIIVVIQLCPCIYYNNCTSSGDDRRRAAVLDRRGRRDARALVGVRARPGAARAKRRACQPPGAGVLARARRRAPDSRGAQRPRRQYESK